MTPENFAKITCADNDLPTNLFEHEIARAIREQVQLYKDTAAAFAGDYYDRVMIKVRNRSCLI